MLRFSYVTGVVQTELGRHMNIYLRRFILEPLFTPFMKTPWEGAQTQIRLAVDPDLANVTGKYFLNCEEATTTSAAQSDETAAWLWTKSIELVKL